ncbi:acetyltransferase [Cyclobacterium sediminis]
MEKTNMKKCIIVGAGTYGQVYSKYLSEEYEILGFVDDNPELFNHIVNDYRVLGAVDVLFEQNRFNIETISIFVPIGDNSVRKEVLEKARAFGYLTPSFIHESVIIDSSVQIEDPVYILPGTTIMPYTKISRDVMVSMSVNIAHHVLIKEGCFFSLGSNVGASIVIEELAYIGMAATLMTGVKRLGANCLIGAGSVVIRDVPDNVIVAGVPAKFLKNK